MSSERTVDHSIFAIVVGIDAYTALPKLQTSVRDAKAVSEYLQNELGAKVTGLYDDEATKDKILEAITSLPSNNEFKPYDAVLFFFSGLAGKAKIEKSDTSIGMICPVDTNAPPSNGQTHTGISDSTLMGLFNHISRSHGNNMTLILDCNSSIFNWGNPDSCVIVTPEVAAETAGESALVKSLLHVLREEKRAERIKYLTVQSLAKRIEVDNSDNRAIHCFGKHADHFLLDRSRGGGHHSFIFGQREIGGKIVLSAGAAQGIKPGTRLAFFVSDVKDENDKCGYLVVESADATRAEMVRCPQDTSTTILPDIFYAVETQYPEENIQVKLEDEQTLTGPFEPKSFSWVKVDQDEPNITLKFEAEHVVFFWNGLKSDKNRRGDYRIDAFKTSDHQTIRMLRNAARLTYHLSRPSPNNALEKGLHIELREITGSGKQRKPSGKDLLHDGCMSTTLGKNDILGPYCLVVENKTGTDLWLYVFMFDPCNLSIIPWYLPLPGLNQPPLKAGCSLPVGCGQCGDEEGLLFEAIDSSSLLYIRVFVTTERTDFSFLQQHWHSSIEDRVRELDSQPVDVERPHESAHNDDFRGRMFETSSSGWASNTATIVLKAKDIMIDGAGASPTTSAAKSAKDTGRAALRRTKSTAKDAAKITKHTTKHAVEGTKNFAKNTVESVKSSARDAKNAARRLSRAYHPTVVNPTSGTNTPSAEKA